MKKNKKVSAYRRSKARSAALDIIKLIKSDHEPIKKLISILKDIDQPIRARRRAFEKFAPALIVHAHSEQESFYSYLKDENKELRTHGTEGEVEHELAEHLIEQIRAAEDATVWSARVKVLAEVVEHHIKEEESQILSAFKKVSDTEERSMIGQQYLELKDHYSRIENLSVEEEEAIEEERNRDYRPSNLMQ